MSKSKGMILPRWFSDEDTLRRLLKARKQGNTLQECANIAEVNVGSISRARSVAKNRPGTGDGLVSKAFFARFDSFWGKQVRSNSRPMEMYDVEDGDRLAKAIAKWKIT